MALITQARTVKSRHIPASQIPSGATHIIFIRLGPQAPLHPGALRIRFADTELSAKRAYTAAVREQHSVEAGWIELSVTDKRDFGVTF